jgi:uncharacterized damage-inducible protein DinB
MNKQSLLELFLRDLDILKKEIMAFANEETIWTTKGSVSNSPGHLCYHLCGNLRHYIGHVLGGNDYIRDREHEFKGPSVTKVDLEKLIEITKSELSKAFEKINEDQFEHNFPIKIFDKDIRTDKFLIHLYGHYGYHLGQINYFRRMN